MNGWWSQPAVSHLPFHYEQMDDFFEAVTQFTSVCCGKAAVLFPLQRSQSYFVLTKKKVTSCSMFSTLHSTCNRGLKSCVVRENVHPLPVWTWKMPAAEPSFLGWSQWAAISDCQQKCGLWGRRLRWNEGRQEPQRKNNKVLIYWGHKTQILMENRGRKLKLVRKTR